MIWSKHKKINVVSDLFFVCISSAEDGCIGSIKHTNKSTLCVANDQKVCPVQDLHNLSLGRKKWRSNVHDQAKKNYVAYFFPSQPKSISDKMGAWLFSGLTLMITFHNEMKPSWWWHLSSFFYLSNGFSFYKKSLSLLLFHLLLFTRFSHDRCNFLGCSLKTFFCRNLLSTILLKVFSICMHNLVY